MNISKEILATEKKTSDEDRPIFFVREHIVLTILACFNKTPFATPVDPDVKTRFDK